MAVADPEWSPYRPPWYPNRDPWHNPWSIPDSASGKTAYQDWCDSMKPPALMALIEAAR